MFSDEGNKFYDVDGAKYTTESALEIANKTFKALGQDMFVMSSASTIEVDYTLPTYREHRSDVYTNKKSAYYVFYYTPAIDNNRKTHLIDYVHVETEATLKAESFLSSWKTPTVKIVVNAYDGLYSYEQDGMIDYGECLNENVLLLPFSDIKSVAERYLPLSPIIPAVHSDDVNPAPNNAQ